MKGYGYRLNDLNRKLKLERFENDAWVLDRRVWGKVEVNLNTMITEHGVLENKNLYTVIVRNFNAVDASMRFTYRNITLYIKHVDSLDAGYLKILCEEVC
jgi:head-tail adaptor